MIKFLTRLAPLCFMVSALVNFLSHDIQLGLLSMITSILMTIGNTLDDIKDKLYSDMTIKVQSIKFPYTNK